MEKKVSELIEKNKIIVEKESKIRELQDVVNKYEQQILNMNVQFNNYKE